MNFNFSFWNCAASPPGQRKRTSESVITDIACVIDYLFSQCSVEFVALCEVNRTSFLRIKEKLATPGLTPLLFNNKTATGSRFDIGCLYDSTRFEVITGKTHTGNIGTSTLKIAQQLTLEFHQHHLPLQLLVSHWPSRLHSIAEDLRNKCSIGLRGFVDNLLSASHQLILMGDYNDEPHDRSLFKNLSATNDRRLVISKPDYWLYNPFWKTLAASTPFTHGETHHDFGTCYSKANNRNAWAAFDQILFSGSFLTTGPWYLKESDTGTVLPPGLRQAVLDTKHVFDHFPVMGSIILKE